MTALRLGIDFGTTRTVVAAAHDGRYPIAAFDDGGEFREWVPGVAALVGGELIVGWDAARALAAGQADHAIRSIKRAAAALPPDAPVPGLPGVTALALLTTFLAELRAAISSRSNLPLDAGARAGRAIEAMVSVPANASSRQRWLTLEAFRRAGFAPIGMLNEPTAAAIEFAHRHLAELGPRSPKRYVVVYDLGGGTFDASAVSLVGRSFDLIATEGLARVGGDDFDEIILAAACAAAGVAVPTDDAAALERAREAKEALRPASKRIVVELAGGQTVQLDVADVYARCAPLIERTLAQTDALFGRLRDAGIATSESAAADGTAAGPIDVRGTAADGSAAEGRSGPIDGKALGGVYLVGGAAAFPAVGRALRARFGKKLQLAPQPFAATAIGLALAADPDASLVVREAATRHFGVWREGQGGADKVFDPLIGKDASRGSDLIIRRRYRPAHTIGRLRFVECGALDADGQPVQDLVPLGEVVFPYAADLPDAEHAPVERTEQRDEIAETYTYGADGTISVRIENLSRGYAREFELGALR